ncbi:uncharacterized protein KIAA1614 homolog [Gastrophryne carolinensis]
MSQQGSNISKEVAESCLVPGENWSELIVAKMEAEVNARECSFVREEKHGQVRSNRSPKKGRASTGRIRSPEQGHKAVKHEEGSGMKTSVLQGKVKALKEKQIKQRKEESKTVECDGGEEITDTLVTPQLRTYLTEELLNCSKHGRFSDQHDGWRSDEFWETCSSEGSSVPYYKRANLSNRGQDTDSSSVKSQDRMSSSSENLVDLSPSTNKRDSVSLTLAERVERNRQELRSKLSKTVCHAEMVTHGGELDQTPTDQKESWVITQTSDGELGVSLPGIEDCRELSVRHEQAKQLLQRARMKAKGAAPLRASHCVLPNPHSQQPTLHRGHSSSGVLTDGGSLSDSSSSDHCSCHKGSRGSSPSHVRFQDESEREAEERYRERQQVPPTSPVIATPLRKRQSNGTISWTEKLSPAGHGQCGPCGSNQATNSATIHGTNLHNVHLGSKITQDSSASSPLAAKLSPHWILPSQPWRMHAELIRETHIGGDSTPDSSGDDDGHRTHHKKSRDPRMHKPCRSHQANAVPEQGDKLHPSYTCSESVLKEGSSHRDQHNENRVKRNSYLSEPLSKTSDPDEGTAARSNCGDFVRTSSKKLLETNATQKYKKSAPEVGNELRSSDQEIGIGSIVLNVDTREGKSQVDSTNDRTQVTLVRPPVVSSHGSPGHVPVPPSGKAPTMAQSRSRHTLRSGVVMHHLNGSHEENSVQTHLDKNSVQSSPVPKPKNRTQELAGSLNSCELSSQGTKSKEHKSRERTQKSKKHPEDRRSKENRDSMKHQSPEVVHENSLQPAMKKGDLRSGMRKIFSSIGLAPRPKMEHYHSNSVEKISSTDCHGRSLSTDGDNTSYDGSLQPGKIKKSPSLQSLKLMSPFHLPRKSSSVQNLTAKSDRSSVYSTGEVSAAPRRTLSVEDIGSPGQARVLGKVAEVFPDGTRLLELQRPDNGTFGFRISSVNGRPDSGIYVQEMSDANTAKLYSGLLRVGDEILEVNGTKVSMLGKSHLTGLLNCEPILQLRVLHQRRTQC